MKLFSKSKQINNTGSAKKTDAKTLKTFSLSTPVIIAGEEVKELEIREPTTADVRLLGMPINFGADGSIDMDMNLLGNYIEHLSDIMNPDDLSIGDFTTIAMEIFGFFGEQMGTMPAPAPAI